METILFCGIQATGKTSFYRDNFLQTHARISMDLMNTRNKEDKFIELCLSLGQRFVIDNTNPTIEGRSKYILSSKHSKFKVIGYYFQSKVQDAIARNDTRQGKEKIPEIGIKGTYNKLELPSYEEGFDELYYVELKENEFVIKPWEK